MKHKLLGEVLVLFRSSPQVTFKKGLRYTRNFSDTSEKYCFEATSTQVEKCYIENVSFLDSFVSQGAINKELLRDVCYISNNFLVCCQDITQFAACRSSCCDPPSEFEGSIAVPGIFVLRSSVMEVFSIFSNIVGLMSGWLKLCGLSSSKRDDFS